MGARQLAKLSIEELTASAMGASEPSFPPPSGVTPGGVDPLGLRQVNFDLMDKVLPGLNNVARHIRPFVLVTWACRRAKHLADASGLPEARVDDLLDFVDRIEVIYAWSQFLRAQGADLPGRDVLSALVRGEKYVFGGDGWRRRREARQFSTAFTSALNYGPALKSLGWVEAHHKYRRLLIARPQADAALDAFEFLITDRLEHPAFSEFGAVEVTSLEARQWADAWADDTVTPAEQKTFAAMLLGDGAPPARRAGGALMIAAVQDAMTDETASVRAAMAGPPSNFTPTVDLTAASEAWRRVQVRQVFRLALEALFSWIMAALEGGPKTTQALVGLFLTATADRPELESASAWLDRRHLETPAPTALLARIQTALQETAGSDLPSSIADALVFCLSEPPAEQDKTEPADRLPLWRARREAEAWRQAPTRDFLGHVIDSWVLAQHVYWSVGRGLADARARGKSILRLRVVLDEGGWTLAPGATRPYPVATPDRLQTALSLAKECGLLSPAQGRLQ